MCRPASKSLDLGILSLAHIWSKKNMGEKKGRGDLNGFRIYLDELRLSQVEWDPWRVVGPEPEYLARSRVVTASRVLLESAFGEYTLAELETFTQPDTDLTRHLRPNVDYATYQRERLAGPLRVREFREVRSQAHGAAEEMRAVGERQSGGEGYVRRGLSGPVRGGPPELLWKIAVPTESANEVVRRMLALENAVRRAASGLPLDLRYPAPTPSSAAQRSQAQRQAAPRMKSARDPPQKKLAERAPPPPVTARRQTRGPQPTTTSEEVAREAMVRSEERYQIKMRQRPSQDEPVRKKRLIMPEVSEEENEEEEEEEGEEEEEEGQEGSSDDSSSNDTTDDPGYKQDPREMDDDDGGDGDWLGED
ncbi:uncharacterized protein LOC131329816 [Rhododendron vialii]|uniref:uncharacterized protein LOC131329816 n=1 Tax=Rhododendron vialii TaxID=182163 RepID=UPI00265EB3B8|nr:uncharacterized protein LOC131329816 [Rhododendron vialii]